MSLEIEWDDDTVVILPYRFLRERCPCGECRALRRACNRLLDAGTGIAAVVAYGANAVNIRFDDGHARGIFPFAYLRELAQELAPPAPAGGISK